jgi:non-ribosomal peptide synthetase component E (peptide arylation enzyme)
METLRELLARERRSERPACRVGTDTRRYDYDNFLTTAWQAGNYLTHLGVREGVAVGIADDPIPEALLATLGTGLLGATAWIDPPDDADLRAVVAPTGDIGAHDAGAGLQRVAYGGGTDDPAIERFEEGVWSENPTMPPERPDPGTPVLTDGNRRFSQRELLEAAGNLADTDPGGVETNGIKTGVAVVLRTPLSDPRAVVGVFATLLAGATVVFPENEEVVGDVTIGAGPEPAVIDPDRIDL